MGIRAFRLLQLGQEVTPGTAVAATAVWRGPNEGLQDDSEIVFVDEDLGVLAKGDRSFVGKLLGRCKFLEAALSFEQAMYPLEAGIKAVGSGTKDGAGSGYIWTYPFGIASYNTLQAFTVEAGDDVRAEEMAYGLVESFDISGSEGGGLNWTVNWIGNDPTETTFTGSLTAPTVSDIAFLKGKLYIDNTGGTWGTTLKSQTLLAAKVNVKTGLSPLFAADGDLQYNGIRRAAPEVTAELTFEFNTTASAEKDKWKGRDVRLIQLRFEGPALATAGTLYTYKTFLINLCGKWAEFSVLDEMNGNDIVTAKLAMRYSPSDDLLGEFVVVNEIATALP